MPNSDPMLEKIEAYNKAQGDGIVIFKRRGGYSLYVEEDGTPVARLRPTGTKDSVEVLHWSYRDRWESIGDFGGVVLPIADALDFVAEDPYGCFWM